MIYLVIFLCFLISLLLIHIYQTRKELKKTVKILDDIYGGNLDRRLLANENTDMSSLVYKMNEIVINDKKKLIECHKAERAYKQFVMSLSHDIRTPLSSLVGYLEVLEKGKLNSSEQQEYLEIAKRKVLNLSDYIQILFEWLKLESGEWAYEFEIYNLCELSRLIFAEWVMKLEQNNIEYEFHIPDEILDVMIDKNAFNRIINNLLNNIMQHSKATKIIVKINYILDDIELSITDNGIGIEENDLPFIFERLYKCDTSRTKNSNGLGLAIVKELTAAMNAKIMVDSCYGGGTTFQLNFKKYK